ncbi:unnamed protein product [Rotaria sp. Silwood1]|nr:unnamed protein product [Rotaria sp. Silwood1]
MFNFGSTSTTTPSNTSLFGTLTPVNQNRTVTSSLFGNTTAAQSNTLASTPFGSTSLFVKKKHTAPRTQPIFV